MIKKRGSALLHFVDRYAGIPAIAALGAFKRRRELATDIESIGLLRTAAIGDTVLISGIVADLRAAFPRANLVFFSGPSNFELALMLEGIDKVVAVPIGNLMAGIRAMRSAPVSVMLDFGQWPRLDALFASLSGAPYTIGFRTKGQHRHYGFDYSVEHSSEIHELQNFRRLVEVLGVKTGAVPRLPRPTAGQKSNDDYVVFHLWPGGRRRTLKEWPIENWVRLAEEFVNWGLPVVLTGGVADGESNARIVSRVRPESRGLVRNAAGINLDETAALLATSRLVVSVDTGVMHMAAALGAPLVALFGPSSPARWGPVTKDSITVQSDIEGCGYISLGWERASGPIDCMGSISYEAVRDACSSMLEKESAKLIIGMPARPKRSKSAG